jgi:hypothetical protein
MNIYEWLRIAGNAAAILHAGLSDMVKPGSDGGAERTPAEVAALGVTLTNYLLTQFGYDKRVRLEFIDEPADVARGMERTE